MAVGCRKLYVFCAGDRATQYPSRVFFVLAGCAALRCIHRVVRLRWAQWMSYSSRQPATCCVRLEQ